MFDIDKLLRSEFCSLAQTKRMSAAEDVEFPMRVLINRQKTRVLFAEIASDFADVLLSFLTLPLGKIVKLFREHYGDRAPVIGSLNSLFNGLENLDDVYFWTKGGKQMLLNPVNSFGDYCRKLKLNLDDSQPPKYFICVTCSRKNTSMYYSTGKCSTCGGSIKEIDFRRFSGIRDARSDTGEVFTKNTTHFTISDDLQMVPNVSGSPMQNLNNFGITDTDDLEERTVHFRLNEIIDLLKGLLLSRAPLTDIILNKSQMEPFTEKYETGISLLQIDEKVATSVSKKMVVKAVLWKSANELLFVQAENDFVDFLFSLLTIPLGGVAQLLGGSTSLRSVDNLYRSIASFNGVHLVETEGLQGTLLEPRLPPMCLSDRQILPLSEQGTTLYYVLDPSRIGYLTSWDLIRQSEVHIVDPKGKGSYVRSPGMFLVTNDLTVTPFSTLSTVSFLSRMKIPVSDIKEVELEIGLEEALGILKASLTTTAVSTNALKPIIEKQPKQG